MEGKNWTFTQGHLLHFYRYCFFLAFPSDDVWSTFLQHSAACRQQTSSLGGHPSQLHTRKKYLSCAECNPGATVYHIVSVQSYFIWNWNQGLINGDISQVSDHPLDNILSSSWCCCCSQRSPQSLALQFDNITCCSTSTKDALGMVTGDIDVFPSCMHHSYTFLPVHPNQISIKKKNKHTYCLSSSPSVLLRNLVKLISPQVFACKNQV